ncbi:MAG: ATP-binding protein [Anaeromyxobacter sp.]
MATLNVPTALVLVGLGLKFAVSLLLAAVLGDLHRRYRRPHVGTWAVAWICYAGAQAGGFLALQLGELPSDDWERVAVWMAGTVVLHWAAALVVIGAWELRAGRALGRGARGFTLGGLAVLGSIPVILTAAPGVAPPMRGLVNVALRSLLAGGALLAASGWILRVRPARGPGPWATALGTALMGVSELSVVVAVGYRAVWGGSPALLFYAAPLLGALAAPALGLAMVVWFLEEERERVVRLTDERAALQDRLRQTQKLEAVGRLASGVVHDLKNLLAVIGAWLPEVRRGTPAEREAAEQIEVAYGRALGLSRQLLSFARKQPATLRRVDAPALVRETAGLLRRTFKAGAVLRVEAEGSRQALADPDQLGHVIMNLGLNARDAIGEAGTVVLAVRERVLAAPTPCGPDLAPPGAYVAVEVRDDGCGMDEQVQAHLFEPFFTTKPGGNGSGLGLSTAYGIVRQGGGYVQVASAAGQGTTFTVLLPVGPGLEAAGELRAPVGLDPAAGAEPN